MNLCRLGSYRLGSIRIFPPAFQTASLQANSQTYKCLYSIWCFSRQWGFVWSHHWGEVIYLCKWFKPIGPRVLSFVLSNLWVHIIATLHKSWWHFGICSKHFSFLNSPFESDFYHRLLYTIKGIAAKTWTCSRTLLKLEVRVKSHKRNAKCWVENARKHAKSAKFPGHLHTVHAPRCFKPLQYSFSYL